MPVYDYFCDRCGPFTEMRPMTDYDAPHECPACAKQAPRAFLTAPYFAAMSKDRRLAHAANERSASAPLVLSELKKTHSAGCLCCSGKSLRSGKQARDDSSRARTFPTRRPWMLSH